MNTLEMTAPGVIGGRGSIASLHMLSCARLLLVSDTHGSAEALTAVVDQFGSCADALLFAGDGIGDVLYLCQRGRRNRVLRERIPGVIFMVAGNCDRASHIPLCGRIQVADVTLFLAHGHTHSVNVSDSVLVSQALQACCSIAVHGHTHVQRACVSSRVLIINPGSLEHARGSSHAGFALLHVMNSAHTRTVFYRTRRQGHRYLFEETVPRV